MGRKARFLTATILPLLCAACVQSTPDLATLNGPSAIIRANSVSASTENYLSVRDTLVARAGYTSLSNVNWYEVAVSGFNYVDEQCADYLNALQRLRRTRDYFRNQLSAAGAATNGILGFTGAGATAIAVTAAAFGLASQLTDNTSQALLYAMDPSDIGVLIQRQTVAFRDGAAVQQGNYNSSTAAMDAVQGYLGICLPVSIEAQVKAAIQGTNFVPTRTNFGVPGLAMVQTASPSVQRAFIVSDAKSIRSGTAVRAPRPAPDNIAGGTLPGEPRIRRPAHPK